MANKAKKTSNSGLGRNLAKEKKRISKKGDESWRHTSELNDGYDWGRLNLRSVTEESRLDDFLRTAELAGTEFIAEKMNVKLVEPDSGRLPSQAEKEEIRKAQEENRQYLGIPRRPKWSETTTREELNLAERESFLAWRRNLAKLQENNEQLILTPYERNMDFWQQLWRVVEMSHVVVQIVDARNPVLFRCEDLERYVKEMDPSKVNMILMNKSDFLSEEQRRLWSEHFTSIGLPHAFWSATAEKDKDGCEEGEKDDEEEEPGEEERDEEEDSSDQEEDTAESDDVYSLGIRNRAGLGFSVLQSRNAFEILSHEESDSRVQGSGEDDTSSPEHPLSAASTPPEEDEKPLTMASPTEPSNPDLQHPPSSPSPSPPASPCCRQDEEDEELKAPMNQSAELHGEQMDMMSPLPQEEDTSQNSVRSGEERTMANSSAMQSHHLPAVVPSESDVQQHTASSEPEDMQFATVEGKNVQPPAEETCSSAKLLTREELLDFFRQVCPRPTTGRLNVGLVGYPNVGKSSTINVLYQQKKTPVSATPGRTKHFQTLFVDEDVCLCDCPGLVFPTFVNTKAEMVCNGILPIDQLRDPMPPIAMVCDQIPRAVIQSTYGIYIPPPDTEGADPNAPPTPREWLEVHARERGFMSNKGNPDCHRASRHILKDYTAGKLLYCYPPPGVGSEEFNPQLAPPAGSAQEEHRTPAAKIDAILQSTINVKQLRHTTATKLPPNQDSVQIVSKGIHGLKGYTRTEGFTRHHGNTEKDGCEELEVDEPFDTASIVSSSEGSKPWKKHHNKHKREKIRRLQ